MKKRGTPQAFKDRARTRYAEYIRRTANVNSVVGRRIRRKKRAMVREYVIAKVHYNSSVQARSTHMIGKAFFKIAKTKSTQAELDALRVTMHIMSDLVEGPWKNAVGIQVAVLDTNSAGRWVEVPMKELEKHYRNVYVRDQAEDDPERFLRGGKLGAGMDETYMFPAAILEDLRNKGTYGLLQPAEKEFFNAMYTWFRERTPDNVYALLTNKNIPPWYAKDLRNHMRLMGVST